MQDEDRDRLVALVERVHQLPYGRPSDRSVRAMLDEGRGTCSTKHLWLYERLSAELPATRPRLVHRVYRVTPADARRRFGDVAARAVPDAGLVDVHRYLLVELDGRDVVVDATFPGLPFDGRHPMPLACGPGEDHVCGGDPAAEKARLEAAHCSPELREPFIAALSSSATP